MGSRPIRTTIRGNRYPRIRVPHTSPADVSSAPVRPWQIVGRIAVASGARWSSYVGHGRDFTPWRAPGRSIRLTRDQDLLDGDLQEAVGAGREHPVDHDLVLDLEEEVGVLHRSGALSVDFPPTVRQLAVCRQRGPARSEEHTSELQSLR